MTKRKRTVKTDKLKAIASTILAMLVIGLLMLLLTGFVKYPEKYLSTWRYHLQCDIENGDEAAIEYYQTNYVANGINLFGEE